MMYRLVMAVLVLFALLPAYAGGHEAAQTAGASPWGTAALSLIFPAGAAVIGWSLARAYNKAKS